MELVRFWLFLLLIMPISMAVTASEPQSIDDLNEWLSADYISSAEVSPVDDPSSVNQYSTVEDTPQNSFITRDNPLLEFTNSSNTLVRTESGTVTEPCVSASCTEGNFIAYIDRGDGIPEPIELTPTQRGALLGLHSAKSGSMDNEMLAYFNGSSDSERLKAAALAEAVLAEGGVDRVTALSVREKIEDGFGVNSTGFGGDTADADYRMALMSGDMDDIVSTRQGLLDSIAEEYINSGLTRDAAYTLAREYIDTAYDQPMLAGQSPIGMPIGSTGSLSDDNYSVLLAADASTIENPTLGLGGVDDIPSNAYANASPVGDGDLLTPSSISNSDLAAALQNTNAATGLGNNGTGSIAGPGPITTVNPSLTGGTVPTSTAPIGDPYGWLDEIQLNRSDIIYVSLKRLLGGPIETVYDSIISSDGTFRVAQGGLVKSDAPDTATTFMVTSLLFFVLMLTALMIFYIFIYGGYKTAQDGKLFGRDWNSFWVPARSIGSAAMVIPIDAVSGMSGAQILVIMVILFGTAFASTLAFFAFRYLMSMPVVEPAIIQNDSFVQSVAKARACVKIHEVLGRPILQTPIQTYFDASGAVTEIVSAPPESSQPESTLGRLIGFFSFGGSGVSDPLLSPGDVRIRNRYIASTFSETGYNARVFGITRYKYGRNGECGTLFVPTLPQQTLNFELDPDIEEKIYGRKRSENGLVLGGVSDDPEASENLATVLQSSKNDGVDFYTTFDAASVEGRLWLNSMRAARFTSITDAYRDLDTKVAAAMDEFYSSSDLTDYDPEDEDAVYPMAPIGELAAALTLAQEDFYQILANGLQNSMTSIEDPSTSIITTSIRQLGWPSIGTFYWLIEHRQTEIMKLFDFSDLKAGSATSTVTTATDQDEEIEIELKKIYGVIERSIGPTGVRLVSNIVASAEAGATADMGSIGSSISGMVTSVFLEGEWFADINNLNVSPIERVRHLGVTLTNAYYMTLMTVGAARNLANSTGEAAKVAPLGTGIAVTFVTSLITGAIDVVTTLFQEVASPMLTGAFICANIIPALPYIMLMAAVFGYLVYCLEALVGVNFWFVNHGNPEGHDVFGKGGDGYPILMTLFLRPTLIVIGFVAGISMNWVFGHLINVTILPATNIQNMEPDGFIGNLSQFAGVILVYSGMQLFASYKSFSLTHELPNAILRWMGVADHQDLGEREGKDLAMGLGVSAGQGMGTKMPTGKLNKRPLKDGENTKDDDGTPPPKGGGNADPNAIGQSSTRRT